MSNANFKSSIWGLDREITLDRVQELQRNIDYSESIEYLEGINDIDTNDKKLLHSWEITSGIQSHHPQGYETEIRYFTAEGYFESAASRISAYADSDFRTLLPRHRRVFQKKADVIFVEIAGRVYSIVYGAASAFQVRTILMGRGLKNRRREEWGVVEETLPQYTFGSDFFYWMYHRHGKGGNIETPHGDIDIRDIEGIGRFSDRQQHNTRGRGRNSTGEISNKSALGIDQLIYESDFVFAVRNMNLAVCIDMHSNCIIDKRRTIYIENNGEICGVTGKEKEILLTLYLEILPDLLSEYHSDQGKKNASWTPSLALQAKKNWAIEVIEELSLHHGITKADLNNLP